MFELKTNKDTFDETTISICALEISCDNNMRKLLTDDKSNSNPIDVEDSWKFSSVGFGEQFLVKSHYMDVENDAHMFQLIEKVYKHVDKSSCAVVESHVLLNFRVERNSATSGEGISGILTFVDLATTAPLDLKASSALRQSQSINSSLGSLNDLLESWHRSKKFVPYRNSLLSLLLHDSLNHENSHVCMFLFGNSNNKQMCTVDGTLIKHADFFLHTWLDKSNSIILC